MLHTTPGLNSATCFFTKECRKLKLLHTRLVLLWSLPKITSRILEVVKKSMLTGSIQELRRLINDESYLALPIQGACTSTCAAVYTLAENR